MIKRLLLKRKSGRDTSLIERLDGKTIRVNPNMSQIKSSWRDKRNAVINLLHDAQRGQVHNRDTGIFSMDAEQIESKVKDTKRSSVELFPAQADELVLGLYKDLLFAQRKDIEISDLRLKLEKKIQPRKNQDLTKYKIEKELVWQLVAEQPVKRWAILVPPPMQPRVMALFHERESLAHLGVVKTYNLMKTRFRWKGLHDDITEYIRSCPLCQQFKSTKGSRKVPLQPKIVRAPNSLVSIDIATIDSFGRRYKYVLTMIDCFTGYAVVVPLKTMLEKEVISVFRKHWVWKHDPPDKIVSDNGSQFIYKDFMTFLQQNGIDYTHAIIL